MKVHIRTYGCQMNERDSEAAAALLVSQGHEMSPEKAADVVIVNTCSVRARAEDKALGKLGLLVAARGRGRLPLVGAAGCMVERMGGGLFRAVRGLDFAVGPGRLAEIPAAIRDAAAGLGPVLKTGGGEAGGAFMCGHVHGNLCAYVTVSQGCNRGCSYCVVPKVRGRERSRPAREIVEEVRSLSDRGARDITLLGQSVTGYGAFNEAWEPSDVSPMGLGEPFPRLLEAAAAAAGPARLRFTSGHPSGCTDELVRVMKEIPAVCNHIHMPFQSGSDRILQMMGRGYTAGGYLDAVGRLRDAVSDLSVTTDVIVGFPTESEADFELTRRVMEAAGFDNAFIFKYSPRPGTRAAEMEDDVPSSVKLDRNHVLLSDQEKRGLRINGAYVGRSLEVLIEGPSLRNERRLAGRSRNNKIVVATGPAEGRSRGFANVLIERAGPQTLYGLMR